MDCSGLSFLKNLPQWNGGGGFTRDSIFRAAELWGNPQDRVKSIHVAGTNGKGSICALVSGILGAAGYRVGLTTSPHLISMNERIVIDGNQIDDEALNAIAEELKELVLVNSISLSFFEAITLLFFKICDNLGLDYMVTEVGLGGRLDATNIISKPSVTAISSIDLDHQDILGNTIAKIAAEKAGIIKSNIPVVIGEEKSDALAPILKKAEDMGAPSFVLGRNFSIHSEREKAFVYSDQKFHELPITLQLEGAHQHRNAAVATKIAQILGVQVQNIQAGLHTTKWPGRIEEINFNSRRCILDAGHNPAGIKTLVDFLNANNINKIDLCFGVIGTKEWRQMVDLLVPFAASWSLLTPQSNQAVRPEEVSAYLSGIGVNSFVFGSQYDDYLNSLSNSSRLHVPVVMVGSIYLMGALRERMGIKAVPLWSRAIQ